MKLSQRLLLVLLFLMMVAPIASAQVGDRDGDGVGDDVDQCISDPGPASTNGCPDGDGDGVRDLDDACPTVAGPISLRGCPGTDADNDRTEDSVDACPGVPGIPENNGCPVDGSDGGSTGGGSDDGSVVAPQINPTRPPEDTDVCMAAPYLNSRVRVRSLPNLAAPVIGLIEPTTVFPVIGLIVAPDGTAYLKYELKNVLVSSLTDATAEDGYSALDTLTLNSACAEPVALLLPAVQAAREAATRMRRAEIKVVFDIVAPDDDDTEAAVDYFLKIEGIPGETRAGYLKIGDIKGEASAAGGDLNGDGVPDIITGSGPGGGPRGIEFDDETAVGPAVAALAKFLFGCCPADDAPVEPADDDCESQYLADLAVLGAQAIAEVPGDGSVKIWIVLPDGTEPPTYECDIQVVKELDKSSPKLQEAVANGSFYLPTSVQFPYHLATINANGVMLDDSASYGTDGTICVDLQAAGTPPACEL